MLRFFYERAQGFDGYNLTNCDDKHDLNPRIGVSPLATTLTRKSKNRPDPNRPFPPIQIISFIPPGGKKYVLPISVGPAPWFWCGPDSKGLGYNASIPDLKNIFSFLRPEQLDSIRAGQCFFMLDQAHEGYHVPWLFEWFHNTCNDYNIPPRQVIYVTGDIEAQTRYRKWASDNNVTPEMLVLGWPHFEDVIHEVSTGYTEFGLPHPGKVELRRLPDFDYQIKFKQFNPHSIKTFNILQKRTRPHRIWFFKYLADADLVKDNLVTMNKFSWHDSFNEGRVLAQDQAEHLNSMLPLLPIENPLNYTESNFSSGDGGQYIIKISDITMLKTWCSVVSEASCSDSEGNCFISEKTFKPIACQHPFIILGSRNVLKNLQELGYKTFHPYINEGYDELPTFERMEYIVKEMRRIQNFTIEEKFRWYHDIEGILRYNYRHLQNRAGNYIHDLYKILTDHIEHNHVEHTANQ